MSFFPSTAVDNGRTNFDLPLTPCHDTGMDGFSEITLHTLIHDSRTTQALNNVKLRISYSNTLHNCVSIDNESCLPPNRFEQTNDVMISDVDIAYIKILVAWSHWKIFCLRERRQTQESHCLIQLRISILMIYVWLMGVYWIQTETVTCVYIIELASRLKTSQRMSLNGAALKVIFLVHNKLDPIISTCGMLITTKNLFSLAWKPKYGLHWGTHNDRKWGQSIKPLNTYSLIWF